MKRFLTVLVLLVLLATMVAFALPALAEEADYKSMSTDELIALNQKIVDELTSRGEAQAAPIGKGDYVVGKDIKAGTYTFTCTEPSKRNDVTTVQVWNSDRSDCLINQSLELNETQYLPLVDGQVLSIYYGSGTIQPSVKPSWAP